MSKPIDIKSLKKSRHTPRFLIFLQSFFSGLLKKFFPHRPEVLFLRFSNEYSEYDDTFWKYQIIHSLIAGFRLRGIKQLAKSSTEYMGVVKVYLEGKLVFHRYLTRPEVDLSRSFFHPEELVEKGVLRSLNFGNKAHVAIWFPGDDRPFYYRF